MAPTGKAALNACGFTLCSSDGLSIPICSRDGAQLTGMALKDLQNRFKNMCAVIIDEYSMVSLKDLYWINDRLQQACVNKRDFGGIPVAFVGDPGKLPPVGALSVWETQTVAGNRKQSVKGKLLHASQLY